MALTRTAQLSEQAFREFSLGDSESRWELRDGQLRERPPMTAGHGRAMDELSAQLHMQLDRREFRLRTQHARLRVSSDTYYIPDIAVIPARVEQVLQERDLDAYPEPLPLVIEIWSPSTGDYDDNEKFPGYQRRGDLEIWRVHPYERSLTAWRRQSDGSYVETTYRDGTVQPAALPGVIVDLDALFGI
jgi:Uma2 family endonuclease